MQDYQILLCKNIHTEEDDASKNLNYDFSNNKVVDTEDVRKLLQYINTPYELSSDEKEKIEAYGDINNDGLIDEKDADELLKIASGSHTKKHFFKEEAYCELGSSSSSFLGKAIDPVFYTKIDGTHELSFSLPSRYLDEGTGEEKENELVNYLTNKDRIRLKKWNNKKQDYDFFSLVVNDTVEKNDGKYISYQYSCTDAFIEELAKTGYNLIFKEEVGENSGFGTIHELAEKILKGTDWHYNKEETGTLLEYTTDIEYNREQLRYDTVYTPVPVHPLEYIEELERYCNKLDTKYTQSKYGQIYCYEDTKQVTSNTVQNILYNANEPVEVSGWTTYNKNKGKVETGLFLSTKERQWSQEDGGGKHYCLSISGGSTANSYLMNDTAAVSNQLIRANQPYVFRFTQAGYDPTVTNAKILSLEIYKDNPLTNILAVPVYSYSPTGGISPANWHIIKTKVSVTTPYIVFKVQSYTNKPLEVYTFNLYEVKGTETRDGNNNILKSAEENNLYLLSTLTDGKVLTRTSTELSMMCSIENPKLTAYTQKEILYFHIDNGDVKYLDFEDEVIDKQKISIATKDKETVEQSGDIDTSLVYRSSKDKRYYQFYTVTRNGRTGEKWDLALFGDGAKDKRRTLAVERSNRFNLLQELAELFKAWCVFNISEREDGTLKKEIWFKENSINTNFSGFHAGVNLQSLERKSDSNEIVTKMIVENQEKDFVDDGVVTITKAELNPWGENYFYNFKYYINQQLLNSTVNINGVEKLKVEYDLEKLYSSVKTSNLTLKKNNEKLAQLNSDLRILQIQQKSLGYCIAGLNESIASLEADLNRTDISAPDKTKTEKNIKNHANQLTKYHQELAQIKDRISGIEVDIKILNQQNNSEQSLKESLILDFEREYAPYIKEGIWSDSSYVDNDSYFLDAQKVSNTSSMPATDWSISVLDGSVIKDLEDFTFSVGDLTILVDNDFFKIKNNPTKNYVFEVLISGIEEHLDNGLENKIEVRNYLTSFEDIFQRVSAATQTLELKEPIYNKAAYFTPDHQVDQGILQNTLLNNQLTLANSSDNSYTLDSSGLSLQSIINPAKKVRLVADGMFFSNSVNIFTGEPIWKTGITAEGINASLLTAGEINTSLIKIYSDNQPRFSWSELGITAYSLNDTTGNSFIRLDTFGIYAVENKIGFNYEEAAEVKNPWFEGLSNEACLDKIINNSIFSLTERGFNFNVGSGSGRITLGTEEDGYGLYIKDSSGENIIQLVNKGNNKIAGWFIDKYRLQSIKDSSVSGKQDVFYLNSNLSNEKANALAIGQVTKNASSYNEANFRVTVGGELHASGAVIDGSSTFSGSITAEKGFIAGWTINGKILQSIVELESESEQKKLNIFYMTSNLSNSNANVLAIGQINKGATSYNEANFRVTAGGVLYAKGAVIDGSSTFSGSITAEKGFIAGWTINGKILQSIVELESESEQKKLNIFYMTSNLSNSNANVLAIGQINKGVTSYNEANFRVTAGGVLYAKGAVIEGNVSLQTNKSGIYFSSWNWTSDGDPFAQLEFGDAGTDNRTGIIADYRNDSYNYHINYIYKQGDNLRGEAAKIFSIKTVNNNAELTFEPIFTPQINTHSVFLTKESTGRGTGKYLTFNGTDLLLNGGDASQRVHVLSVNNNYNYRINRSVTIGNRTLYFCDGLLYDVV